MNLLLLLQLILWALLPWSAALPSPPPNNRRDFIEYDVANNEIDSNDKKPITIFGNSIYQQEALDLYLTTLEKHLERTKPTEESDPPAVEAKTEIIRPTPIEAIAKEISSLTTDATTTTLKPETTEGPTSTEAMTPKLEEPTTKRIMSATGQKDTTTETVIVTTKPVPTTLKTETRELPTSTEETTSQFEEPTTNRITPTSEKPDIWQNVKFLVTKIEKDYNPIEPIAKAIDGLKDSEIWGNINNYATKGYDDLNKFSEKSVEVIKENYKDLTEKVKDSWMCLKKNFKLW